MRSVEIQFPSGREVLSCYWGFLDKGGLILKEHSDLTEGDSVLLDVKIKSLKTSYQLPARVIRRLGDERQTFVAFSGDSDCQLLLNAAWADTHDVPQRKHRRYLGTADVQYSDKKDATNPGRGRIVDVSPGGCRVKGSLSLPPGTRLVLLVRGVELEGEVRWSTPGNEMGIEFFKPELAIQTFLLDTAFPR